MAQNVRLYQIVFLLLTVVLLVRADDPRTRYTQRAHLHNEHAEEDLQRRFKSFLSSESVSLCSVCVTFFQDSLEELLYALQQSTLFNGECSSLCGFLTNSIEEAVCETLCNLVGVEAFTAALDAVEPEPIWLCTEIHACPIITTGAASIDKAYVSPGHATLGSTFTVVVNYTVTSETGTGQVNFTVVPPNDLPPFGGTVLTVDQEPGQYQEMYFVPTHNNDANTPTGTYNVTVELCEGMCGSVHAPSTIYDVATTSFEVTATSRRDWERAND